LQSFWKKNDSAQENFSIENVEFRENLRNELFDRIAYSGMSCYAALRKDFVKEKYFRYNIFCGQVAEIENVISQKNKECYVLTFTDYKNNENEYAHCVIEKKYLLPLFCFDPTIYKKMKTIHNEYSDEPKVLRKDRVMTVQEIRDQWEEQDFSVNLNDTQLTKHTKLETRFNRGQLVTVVFDFKPKSETNENENFIIQAGQVGIISNDKKNDKKNKNFVEVTFWSIPFGLLALKGENFVSSPLKHNPLIYATNPSEKKISIHKDFLFPLYCEALESSM
jgi:hypothetical protein